MLSVGAFIRVTGYFMRHGAPDLARPLVSDAVEIAVPLVAQLMPELAGLGVAAGAHDGFVGLFERIELRDRTRVSRPRRLARSEMFMCCRRN
jgi:hypothetical protein